MLKLPRIPVLDDVSLVSDEQGNKIALNVELRDQPEGVYSTITLYQEVKVFSPMLLTLRSSISISIRNYANP